MEYRRTGKFDTWHFRPDCTRWPADGSADLEVMRGEDWRPKLGQLCAQCRAKGSPTASR